MSNRARSRLVTQALQCTLLLCLWGCAFQPQQAISNLCYDCDYQRLNVGDFVLSAYWRNKPGWSTDSIVHVYLEGDGQPWHRGRSPSTNPNSRRLTALQLMMRDRHSSVYLTRPCYGLEQMPGNCTPERWTGGRYSDQVVQAMQKALDRLQKESPEKRWLLIGHSGGGSLAMLIAQGREDVAGIITLAANLDTDAWTRHFGYLPLDKSLNAAVLPLLPAQIPRWHFAAVEDAQVPASLVADAARRDHYARYSLLPGDHHCCWQEHWPRIPDEMTAQLNTQFTGTK